MAKNQDNNPKKAFLTHERKLEILGVILMAISVLFAISIVTYTAEDYPIISGSSFESLLKLDQGPAARIQNGLGVLGAYISHFFVRIFFGYVSIVVPILIFQYAWYIFRHREVNALFWNTGYLLGVMVLVASFFGWFEQHLDAGIDVWAGSTGLAIAAVFRTFTAPVGSFIIFFVLSLVALLLVIDRDIQATIDRVKLWADRIRLWVEERKAISDAKKAEQIAAKAEAQELTKTDLKREAERKEVERVKIAKDEKAFQDETKTVVPQNEPEKDINQPDETIPEIPRVILEQSPAEPDPLKTSDEDIEMNVYVGKAEEVADVKDLEKDQKAKAVPLIKYKFPTIDLLDSPPNEGNEVDFEEINHNKAIILDKLKRHGIEIVAIEAIVGPTVTLYELEPAPDVKISRIESYANDLKMAMAAHGIRIIAPIPGKSAVGIEVPNRKRETVFIKQVINTKKFVETKMYLPVAFGKTIENEVYMVDLTQLPHLLIAGATGSGKSVGINTILTCLLYKCHPENLKFVLVDPKKIELSLYRHLQNHFLATLPDAEEPIITDTTKVMEALVSVCKEMDDRYDLLKMGLVRDIRAYNDKFKSGELEPELGHRHLPYIVVVIDELADLMLTAGKAIEEPIARIAQLARAVGIHLVVATQRPSVNVITGTIKANFPVRIAYQVASKIDSRTILDTSGADQLVGRGDMLVSGGGKMIRVQNAFVSTEEVERINAFIGNQLGYSSPFRLPKVEDPTAPESSASDPGERDELFEEAAKVVILHQQGSVSLIQRKLKLGYNRAGRIIDQLYAAGVVGPYQGSTAREVLIADEDEFYEHIRNQDAD